MISFGTPPALFELAYALNLFERYHMLQITFRHMDSCDSVRHVADEKFARLIARYDRAAHGHLVIDQEHRHAASPTSSPFTAHLALTIGRTPGHVEARVQHEIAASAVREAFEIAERQLAAHDRRTG